MSGFGFADWGAASVLAGHVAVPHSHGHERFVVVLEGGGTSRGPSGSCALRPGVVLRFAPGAVHEAVFDAPTVLVDLNLPEAATTA